MTQNNFQNSRKDSRNPKKRNANFEKFKPYSTPILPYYPGSGILKL
jgi:hypothetical protein